MQTWTKATVLALGLLTSGTALVMGGTALANDNFGGSRLYNPQYSYGYPPYYYSGYPYYSTYGYAYGYPSYGAYGYPSYGWYTGTAYPWAQSYWGPYSSWSPYSSTNPNWIPYVGWR